MVVFGIFLHEKDDVGKRLFEKDMSKNVKTNRFLW